MPIENSDLLRLRRSLLAGFALAFALVAASTAFGSVTLTPASGGLNISADRAANASSPLPWTTLGQMTIVEGAKGDIGNSGTLVLRAPAGFEFNTVVTPDATWMANRDITGITVTVSNSTTIGITITSSGTGSFDNLTVGGTTGIQVRPTTGAVLSSGQIFRPTTNGGSLSIAGIVVTSNPDGSGGTSFGALSEVAGSISRLSFTSQPGAANVGQPFGNQPVVSTFDQFGNSTTSS